MDKLPLFGNRRWHRERNRNDAYLEDLNPMIQKINDIIDLGVNDIITDTTYAALKAEAAAGTLREGALYKITDFRQRYMFLLEGDPSGAKELRTGALEPLIVQATSPSSIGQSAVSTVYPADIILYDMNYVNLISDHSYPDDHLGVIIYRKNQLTGNEAYHDFRTIQVRHWRVDFPPYLGLAPVSAGAYILAGPANPVDGDTVTINGITYEFDDNASVLPGNIQVVIQLNPSQNMAALLGVIQGTDALLGAAMFSPLQGYVYAMTPGSAGNAILTGAVTWTDVAWTDDNHVPIANLFGGSDGVDQPVSAGEVLSTTENGTLQLYVCNTSGTYNQELSSLQEFDVLFNDYANIYLASDKIKPLFPTGVIAPMAAYIDYYTIGGLTVEGLCKNCSINPWTLNNQGFEFAIACIIAGQNVRLASERILSIGCQNSYFKGFNCSYFYCNDVEHFNANYCGLFNCRNAYINNLTDTVLVSVTDSTVAQCFGVNLLSQIRSSKIETSSSPVLYNIDNSEVVGCTAVNIIRNLAYTRMQRSQGDFIEIENSQIDGIQGNITSLVRGNLQNVAANITAAPSQWCTDLELTNMTGDISLCSDVKVVNSTSIMLSSVTNCKITGSTNLTIDNSQYLEITQSSQSELTDCLECDLNVCSVMQLDDCVANDFTNCSNITFDGGRLNVFRGVDGAVNTFTNAALMDDEIAANVYTDDTLAAVRLWYITNGALTVDAV